jgi:hypothetical protein
LRQQNFAIYVVMAGSLPAVSLFEQNRFIEIDIAAGLIRPGSAVTYSLFLFLTSSLQAERTEGLEELW